MNEFESSKLQKELEETKQELEIARRKIVFLETFFLKILETLYVEHPQLRHAGVDTDHFMTYIRGQMEQVKDLAQKREDK